MRCRGRAEGTRIFGANQEGEMRRQKFHWPLWALCAVTCAALANGAWAQGPTRMVHDAADRLTGVSTPTQDIQYQYDAAGNLKRVVRRGPVTPADLVAWWSFDACDARDDSGHAHHGTVFGMPECVDSARGKALRFTGTAYIEVPHHSDFSLGELTLAAWLRVSALSPDLQTMILNKENEYEFGVQGPAIPHQQLQQGDLAFAFNSYWWWYGVQPAVLDQPVHFAVTYDSQRHATAYVNGQAVRSIDYASPITPTANAIRIGARGAPYAPWEHFLGDIDDVRVYRKALSATEVSTLYWSGAPR